MSDGKKSFWTTMPGIISGIAAIVTGLGVLIPLLLGVGSKHTDKNAVSQSPSPGVTTTTGSEGTTSTAGGGTTGNASPSPTDSLGSPGAGTGGSPGTTGATGLTVDPPNLSFGTVRASQGTSDQAVTLTNPGSVPVSIAMAWWGRPTKLTGSPTVYQPRCWKKPRFDGWMWAIIFRPPASAAVRTAKRTRGAPSPLRRKEGRTARRSPFHRPGSGSAASRSVAASIRGERRAAPPATPPHRPRACTGAGGSSRWARAGAP